MREVREDEKESRCSNEAQEEHIMQMLVNGEKLPTLTIAVRIPLMADMINHWRPSRLFNRRTHTVLSATFYCRCSVLSQYCRWRPSDERLGQGRQICNARDVAALKISNSITANLKLFPPSL